MEPSRIELFGYPGCGKTTSMHNLQAEWADFETKEANIPFSINNVMLLFKFLVVKPKVISIFGYMRFVPRKYFKYYMSTIIRFCFRMLVIEKDLKSNHRYIVDEGILQVTWSLLLLPTIYSDRFNVENKLEYLSKHLWPNLDLLVYHISITDKEYSRRINSRERKHFFSVKFVAKDAMYIEKGKEIKNMILEEASNKYRVRQL